MGTMGRLGIVVLAAASVAGCGDSGFGPVPGETFLADLAPVSGVESSAIGVAVFVKHDDGRIEYALGGDSIAGVTDVRLLAADSGALIASLFHSTEGSAEIRGQFGGGMLTTAMLSGGLSLEGLVDKFRREGAVVMVHTIDFPDGEIRGTVRPHVSMGASAPAPPPR